jgi:hypothetical protein
LDCAHWGYVGKVKEENEKPHLPQQRAGFLKKIFSWGYNLIDFEFLP